MSRISPILIAGVILYAFPIIMNIFKFTLWGWITTLAFILVVLGVLHTGYIQMQN